MLSNKMTFSLMSLITIIALAFVVPSAMAGEFDVTLDGTEDVSAAADFQMDHPGTSLVVTIKSGQAIALPAASVFVTTYDEDGVVLGFPTAVVAPVSPLADKELTLTIPVTADDAKVNIKIAKGIASADPINADTSKALDATIFLVDADVAGLPTVYSIRRADNPLLPVTAATVQVIVTLSEMPKEFKKGNLIIDAAHGTIADPVALDPVVEDPARFRALSAAIGRSSDEDVPPLHGVYNITRRTATGDVADDTTPYATGINAAIATDAAADTPSDEAEALNDALAAYNTLADDAGTAGDIGAETTLEAILVTTLPEEYQVGIHPPVTTFTLGANNAVTYPTVAPGTTPAWHPIDDEDTIEEQIEDADVLAFMRNAAPVHPGAFGGNAALLAYQALLNEYKLYQAEAALHTAYIAAVEAVMEDEDDALSNYFAVELGELVPDATGRDDMLHPYVVTITPKYPAGKPDIVLKVGVWEDTTLPLANKYDPASMRNAEGYDSDGYMEGRNQLTIKVGTETLTALTSGTQLYLPHGEGAMIPASGFYLLTKNKDGSGINYSHEKDDENLAHKQTLAQLKFNVRAAGIPNLQAFLSNGGTIDLVAYDGTAATAAYISEVMWGSDASQADSTNSQWIEIANTTAAAIAVGEKKWALWIYQANETPAAAYTGGTLIDQLSTTRSDWTLIGRGQGGRTNVDPGGADVAAIAPTQPLVSMVRVANAAGAPLDGTLPTSWTASTGPSANFKLGIEGTRVATPGASPITRPTAPTPPAVTPTVPAAVSTDIMITEIMVDADNGRLPQWIELSHVGTGEVSLDGWEMVIDNAIDADVIGGGNAITVSLSGATLDVSAHTGNTGKGQSVLVVAWAATRHSANIRADRIINIATQLNQTRQYQLLSYKGFRITLVPPQTGAIAAFGDVAGNLDEEWELPMDEGTTRSSMIRREMAGTPAAATLGTDANGWVLASSTSLVTGQQSYYGNDEDAGTPGQDAGGPLPVELSHFRPARDKTTGAVVITWATQSELNNAGFFIKRSNQRDGQFQVINSTMVAGAGTTSEKQFYTYTDTTAQPNVVYYYQIEDVSLDGNRQTLTRGIRLKGHIGAAGKATTTWGDLKTSNE